MLEHGIFQEVFNAFYAGLNEDHLSRAINILHKNLSYLSYDELNEVLDFCVIHKKAYFIPVIDVLKNAEKLFPRRKSALGIKEAKEFHISKNKNDESICEFCENTGYISATEKITGKLLMFKCFCKIGQSVKIDMDMWKRSHLEHFEPKYRKRIPLIKENKIKSISELIPGSINKNVGDNKSLGNLLYKQIRGSNS